jgi:hypothetical protein
LLGVGRLRPIPQHDQRALGLPAQPLGGLLGRFGSLGGRLRWPTSGGMSPSAHTFASDNRLPRV